MKTVDKRKCAKQTVVALLITADSDYFVGSNWCGSPQKVCPRGDMKSGEGYEICESVCRLTHAEVDACRKAGKKAEGATLFLIGHTYCCENCLKIMTDAGVVKVVVL